MESYLEKCRQEVGLPLPDDWCEHEAKRLFEESHAAGFDLVCGGRLPAWPCGGMRQQAEENRQQLERRLEHSARASAHKRAHLNKKS